MWYYNKTVTRTHAKDGAKMAWAIISGVSNNWLRVRPDSPDGVSNIHMLLSKALANNRTVDVYVLNNYIISVTLR